MLYTRLLHLEPLYFQTLNNKCADLTDCADAKLFCATVIHIITIALLSAMLMEDICFLSVDNI